MAKSTYSSRRDPNQRQRGIPGGGVPKWYQLKLELRDANLGVVDINARLWDAVAGADIPVAAYRLGLAIPPQNWQFRRAGGVIPATLEMVSSTTLRLTWSPAEETVRLWIDAGIGALTSNQGLACAGIDQTFPVWL